MLKKLLQLWKHWTTRRVAVQSSEFARRFPLYQIEHSYFNHDWQNRGGDEEGWKLRKQQWASFQKHLLSESKPLPDGGEGACNLPAAEWRSVE
jgi:hypothetical protein